MARQKLVFANASELTHVWANQVQDEGRSNNMSFNTRGIYSYAVMLASFRTEYVVFLNNRSYSNTTSSHQSAIFSACSHKTLFDYDIIPKWASGVAYIYEDPSHITPLQIWQQYRDIWFSLLSSASEKRFSRTSAQRLDLASMYAKKANSIATVFSLECDALSVDIGADIQQLIEAENARKERKRVADFEQCKQERENWFKGIERYYPNRYESDIVLRVSPVDAERVETSRGAFVPLRVCERLYRAFKAATMPDDREVGSYHLDKISVEGITIGCHVIKAKELERFAKVLGVAA